MSPADEARRATAPSGQQREKMGRIARSVTESVEKAAAGHGALEVALGGSFAKGTWLAEGADIDVFVLFKADVSKEQLREKAKKVGFEALAGCGPYTRYAEHPFVEAVVDGVKVNVVPCYDVPAGMWKSAADRSRFHTAYMREALDERGRADARVLKKFLKANGVYGAEIARQGFSGYVAEVLVVELGSFEGVLEKFAGIGRGEAIGRAEKEFETPVSIADPVDGGRNLAAAISEENVARFVMAARAYLKDPSGRFSRPTRPAARAGARGRSRVPVQEPQPRDHMGAGQAGRRAGGKAAVRRGVRGGAPRGRRRRLPGRARLRARVAAAAGHAHTGGARRVFEGRFGKVRQGAPAGGRVHVGGKGRPPLLDGKEGGARRRVVPAGPGGPRGLGDTGGAGRRRGRGVRGVVGRAHPPAGQGVAGRICPRRRQAL